MPATITETKPLVGQRIRRKEIRALMVTEGIEKHRDLVVLPDRVTFTQARADAGRLVIATHERHVQVPRVKGQVSGCRLRNLVAIFWLPLSEASQPELALSGPTCQIVCHLWRTSDLWDAD